MTQSSRALLAKFFKVHPGFLVDDPEGYHTELTSDLRTTEGQLDVWLLQGSERFVSDPEVSDVLIKAAREKDTRRSLAAAGRDSRYARISRASVRSLAAGIGGECSGRNLRARRHREELKRSTNGSSRLAERRREASPMNHSMTWADFYLICFAVGFCFSFFSFVLGGARTGRLHLPHFHGHVGGVHLPSATVPAAHAPVSRHMLRPGLVQGQVRPCSRAAEFRRSTSSR